jgi:hypothetical protein
MRYRELKEYREQRGECKCCYPSLFCAHIWRNMSSQLVFVTSGNVPTKYKKNKALGRWVSTQRAMHKRYTELTKDESEGSLNPDESLEHDPEQALLYHPEDSGDKEDHSLGGAEERIAETEPSLDPEESVDPEDSLEQGVSLAPEERIEIQRRINLLEELDFIWRMIPSPPPSDSSSTERREEME